MIVTMTKQMLVFCIVWLIIIIFFAITGQLVFYELVNFTDLTTTFTFLIEAALGGWDLSIFLNPRVYSCQAGSTTTCYEKPRPFYDQYIGLFFMLIYVVLNLVIIINLVVAILSTTYSDYSEYQRGLYYDTLIQSLPVNQYHKYYGCMVTTPSILSVTMLILAPFLWLLQCVPRLLKSINRTICTVMYMPMGLIALIVFLLVSIVSLPFAWFYTVVTKFKFDKWALMTGRKLPKAKTFRSSWLAYIFVGPLQMTMRLLADTCIFTKHLFIKVKNEDELTTLVFLKLQYFEMIEDVLESFGGLYCTKPVPLKKIIVELQKRLGLFALLKA